MKYSIALLLVLLSSSVFSQSPSEENVAIWFDNNPVKTGGFIDIQDLKNIEVRPTSEAEKLEVQFVVVPIGLNYLSFRQPANDLKNLDIIYNLELASIPLDKIAMIMMTLSEGEMKPALFSVNVITRKLETALDYFNEFKMYAAVGDKENAQFYVEKASLLEPTSLEYRNAKGQFYYETGQFELAKTEFKNIVKESPNYLSYSYLAQLSIDFNELENALEISKKAFKLASNDVEKSQCHYVIATVNAKQFNYEAAYKSFLKAIEFNPTNVNALNDITAVCDEVGRHDEKVGYFNKIIELGPDFYLVHVNIGFHYLQDEKYEDALSEFDAVLAIEPNQAIALSNKAFCLYKMGELDDALLTINSSITLTPSNSYAFKNRALIYIALKDVEAACTDLQTANQLNYTLQYGDEVNELIEKNCK